MKLSKVLKRLLKEGDVTASQLSRSTKIPGQTIHNWLNGYPPKNIDQLKKVAEYFECSIDYLCFETNPLGHERQFKDFEEEINAGVFEVILRKVKSPELKEKKV